jgi:hypothetical protein
LFRVRAKYSYPDLQLNAFLDHGDISLMLRQSGVCQN